MQLKGKTGYLERKEPAVFYLQFNQTKAEFQNKKIRQALAKSVDREQYVKQVLAGASVF